MLSIFIIRIPRSFKIGLSFHENGSEAATVIEGEVVDRDVTQISGTDGRLEDDLQKESTIFGSETKKD